MSVSDVGRSPYTIDAGRHRVRRLDPAQYLASSCCERWLARLEEAIVAGGALSRHEIEAKIKEFSENRDLPVPRREDAAARESVFSGQSCNTNDSQETPLRRWRSRHDTEPEPTRAHTFAEIHPREARRYRRASRCARLSGYQCAWPRRESAASLHRAHLGTGTVGRHGGNE